MSKKTKKPEKTPAQPVKTVEQPQPCLKEATASTAENLNATNMVVVTENYIYGQDPEVLPDDDPRKGTVSDPNMQDRAWVNRNFTFNLKRR